MQDRGEKRQSGRQRARAGQREHTEREGLEKTKKYKERRRDRGRQRHGEGWRRRDMERDRYTETQRLGDTVCVRESALATKLIRESLRE